LLAVALSVVALLTGYGFDRVALAATEVDHFRAGADALAEGKYEQAIAHFEAYADREAPHPDASYNRGVAYITRVRSGSERSGDLGRAAASFEQALMLRPQDSEARQALQLVHAEVARRRARRGKDALQARPTLDRVVVGLASERGWGSAAVVASVLLSIGLVLRRRAAGATKVAGQLTAPACALLLCALLPLYLGARHLRLTTQPGVVVVGEAHMTDEEGVTLGGEAIPEAARVELGERRGRLVHVRYGSREGWLSPASVRVLRKQ
jgi:tetratricopeptide (TPR) repeat protein